jgi:hypothetical protein
MARNKPLTVVLYYKGEQVETLPQEARDNISKRLSEVMSTYYTAHPEEYLKVKSVSKNREE